MYASGMRGKHTDGSTGATGLAWLGFCARCPGRQRQPWAVTKNGSVDLAGHHTRGHTRYALGTQNPHTPTQGNTTTLKRRQGAQHGLYGRIYILSSLWQDSHFRMFLPFAFTYLLAVAQMMYHAIVGARRNVTRLGPWLCLCLLLQGSSSSFRGVMVFRASSSQWLRLRRQRGGVARPPRRR